jgi:hypothetical protein
MIRSYRDSRSGRFAQGERVPGFESFRHRAEKGLRILEAATGLRDLAQLRSNRLEALAVEGSTVSGSISSGASASNGRKEPMGLKTLRLSITTKESKHGAHPHPPR